MGMEGGLLQIDFLNDTDIFLKKKKEKDNYTVRVSRGTICTSTFNVLSICLVIFISTKSAQCCISLSCPPCAHVQHISVSIHETPGNCFFLL